MYHEISEMCKPATINVYILHIFVYIYIYVCMYVNKYLWMCLLIRFEQIFSMFRELRFKHLVFCIFFLNRQKQEQKRNNKVAASDSGLSESGVEREAEIAARPSNVVPFEFQPIAQWYNQHLN